MQRTLATLAFLFLAAPAFAQQKPIVAYMVDVRSSGHHYAAELDVNGRPVFIRSVWPKQYTWYAKGWNRARVRRAVLPLEYQELERANDARVAKLKDTQWHG